MRTSAAVEATAILILVSEVWVCASRAEDAIKPGKWEIWTVEGPKVQKPPSGTQLPDSMRWGPEGLITSACVTETKLKPPHVHKRDTTSQGILGKGSCEGDMTTDTTTGTRKYVSNCTWSSGATYRLEGVFHFHGDTLDGTTTNRLSLPDKPPTEQSSVLKGRYVGPCDAK